MKSIFISCRVRGDTQSNLRDAKKYYEFAVSQGVAPIMPHLVLADGILDDDVPEQRQKGIEISSALLLKADAVWAVVDEQRGISEGMSNEIELAIRYDIPVVLISKQRILRSLQEGGI